MNATEATLRSLHGIAELVLAGPQHRASRRIRLCATPGGFGTTLEPDLRVEGDQLVAGTRPIPLEGATYRDAAGRRRGLRGRGKSAAAVRARRGTGAVAGTLRSRRHRR